jgi:hypothetical protein
LITSPVRGRIKLILGVTLNCSVLLSYRAGSWRSFHRWNACSGSTAGSSATDTNATRLAERFEVSGKTAQRDTALMRDRLMAPIEYDSQWIGNWLPIDEIGY